MFLLRRRRDVLVAWADLILYLIPGQWCLIMQTSSPSPSPSSPSGCGPPGPGPELGTLELGCVTVAEMAIILLWLLLLFYCPQPVLGRTLTMCIAHPLKVKAAINKNVDKKIRRNFGNSRIKQINKSMGSVKLHRTSELTNDIVSDCHTQSLY